MKLYRYMSLNEFSKLTSGCTLIQRNSFSKNRTESTGFCFIGEKTGISSFSGDGYTVMEFSPEQCFQFLNGIVTAEVLVEFESIEIPQESIGIYADPICQEWGNYVDVVEYTYPSYSLETAKPVRYKMVDSSGCDTMWYQIGIEEVA